MEKQCKDLFTERLNSAAFAVYGKKHGAASRLCEDIGVSAQTTSKWMRGLAVPSRHHLSAIGRVLNVPVSWLTGESHEPPKSVADLRDEGLEIGGKAVSAVFPLLLRLEPGANDERVDRLFRHAYQQIKAGHTTQAVTGEIAAMLINKEE